MRFRFVSQQLSFEKGEVSFWSGSPSGDLVTDPQCTVHLSSNETDDFPIVGPRAIQLLCTDCMVRLRSSGIEFVTPALRLSTLINEKDMAVGVTEVMLGFFGIVRVEAVDQEDQPLAREHVFGVSLPGMSIEAKGPEGSPLNLLLPPGEYIAYLCGLRPIQVPFVVHEGQEDAGTIRLREPPGSDSRM